MPAFAPVLSPSSPEESLLSLSVAEFESRVGSLVELEVALLEDSVSDVDAGAVVSAGSCSKPSVV